MNLQDYYFNAGEKPLDRIPQNGGFAAIFRTIACVGDSLSSGEFQIKKPQEEGYYYFDQYEYSWGQFMARTLGSKVYNFSRGGMSAKWYLNSYADENGFFDPAKKAQAYIFALGVNDVSAMKNGDLAFGTKQDIVTDPNAPCANSFTGYYTKILAKYRQISPFAKFFLITCPKKENESDEGERLYNEHAALLRNLAAQNKDTYVLDFRTFAPPYDEAFRRAFYLNGHLTPTGYRLTAEMVMAYIDYYIRKEPDDFKYAGLIATNNEGLIATAKGQD